MIEYVQNYKSWQSIISEDKELFWLLATWLRNCHRGPSRRQSVCCGKVCDSLTKAKADKFGPHLAPSSIFLYYCVSPQVFFYLFLAFLRYLVMSTLGSGHRYTPHPHHELSPVLP